MTDQDRKASPQGQQRRGVLRTVLVLLAVVVGIYLFFIGRAFINYPGA